ncbi:MAG: glycosyltransferase family 4 protein [Armatimonadota bacterium]
MKRLGIYYATACYSDEQGRYYTSPGLGIYLQLLNRMFPFEVVLVAPVTRQPLPHLKYSLPESRVAVYELPYFETFVGAVRVRNQLIKRMRKFFSQHAVDVMWLRYPGAYATELWLKCRRLGIPCFYEAVGDTVQQFELLAKTKPLVGHIQLLVARWHEWEMRRIATTTPCIAVAPSLARKLGNQVVWFPASTLTQDDFFYRRDTCQNPIIQVLFVGGFVRMKSVETLIDAIGIMQQQNLPVYLNLVGDGELRRSLQQRAQNTLKPHSFRFHGYITDRQKLLTIYRQSDIFAMSSLTEGFPRVILEAFANGLPVVATNVAGVPDIVKHGESGLLVQPLEPGLLAASIQRVIEDAQLRQRVIAGGYEIARVYTAEAFLSQVISFVHSRLNVNLLSEE